MTQLLAAVLVAIIGECAGQLQDQYVMTVGTPSTSEQENATVGDSVRIMNSVDGMHNGNLAVVLAEGLDGVRLEAQGVDEHEWWRASMLQFVGKGRKAYDDSMITQREFQEKATVVNIQEHRLLTVDGKTVVIAMGISVVAVVVSVSVMLCLCRRCIMQAYIEAVAEKRERSAERKRRASFLDESTSEKKKKKVDKDVNDGQKEGQQGRQVQGQEGHEGQQGQ